MNSKQKGNRGEIELLSLLRAKGLDAVRNDQRYIGGKDNPDIALHASGKAYHLEVKRTEKLNIWAAIEQAQRDAEKAIPVVVFRRNRSPWMVCVSLNDWIKERTE